MAPRGRAMGATLCVMGPPRAEHRMLTHCSWSRGTGSLRFAPTSTFTA